MPHLAQNSEVYMIIRAFFLSSRIPEHSSNGEISSSDVHNLNSLLKLITICEILKAVLIKDNYCVK